MSFPKYPEYKESGVEWLGNVPEHWNKVRLRRVVKLNPSKSEVSNLNRELSVSFLPMESIRDNGSINLEKSLSIGAVENGYTYFREDDVALAKITPCFENGKGAIMRGLINGIGFGTTELIIVRPKPSRTTSDYLHWLFLSSYFRRMGESTMYGAGGQKRVPDDFVRNLCVAIPPIKEQTAIASFLDTETSKIDGLVGEQRRLIELLKEKRQAVISHAVTKGLNPNAPMKPSGIEWLGDVPEHWKVKPLKYLAAFRSGGTPSKTVPAYWHGDVPWASSKDLKTETLADTIDHITQHALDNDAATLVPAGSVLVVVRGMILLHTFPVVQTLVPMAINQDLKALTPSECIHESYLPWLLRGSTTATFGQIDEAAHGTKVLRMEALTSIELPVPPIDEQLEIAETVTKRLTQIACLVAKAEAAIELLQERRVALISAAVTGKTDVREFANASPTATDTGPANARSKMATSAVSRSKRNVLQETR